MAPFQAANDLFAECYDDEVEKVEERGVVTPDHEGSDRELRLRHLSQVCYTGSIANKMSFKMRGWGSGYVKRS